MTGLDIPPLSRVLHSAAIATPTIDSSGAMLDAERLVHFGDVDLEGWTSTFLDDIEAFIAMVRVAPEEPGATEVLAQLTAVVTRKFELARRIADSSCAVVVADGRAAEDADARGARDARYERLLAHLARGYRPIDLLDPTVPRRDHPSPPALLQQSANSPPAPKTLADAVCAWSYTLEFRHALVPQDVLHVDLEINQAATRALIPSRGGDAPLPRVFTPLARYVAVRESLWDAMRRGEADARCASPGALSLPAVQTFARLVDDVVRAWPSLAGDALSHEPPSRHSAHPASVPCPAAAHVDVRVGRSPAGDRITWAALGVWSTVGDGLGAWPEFGVRPAAGGEPTWFLPAEHGTATPIGDGMRVYRPPEGRIVAAPPEPSIVLRWGSLHVGRTNLVACSCAVTRNAALGFDPLRPSARVPATAEAFVMDSAEARFANPCIPLVERMEDITIEGGSLEEAFAGAIAPLIPNAPKGSARGESHALGCGSVQLGWSSRGVPPVRIPVGMSLNSPLASLAGAVAQLRSAWSAPERDTADGDWLIDLTVFLDEAVANGRPIVHVTLRYGEKGATGAQAFVSE